MPSRRAAAAAALALLSLAALSFAAAPSLLRRRRRARAGGCALTSAGLVGATPLVRLASLCAATGCEVWAKAEFLNPGGSVKDRVAVRILDAALSSGALRPGGLVCEGSAGSTGVSLALAAAGRGLRCFVSLPDDAAAEKAATLRALGAEVVEVRPASIAHPGHYVNVARRRAADEVASHGPGAALFADQFENEANFEAHRLGTGPELWRQRPGGGRLHAFVCAAGTGGSLAGVGAALRSRDPAVRLYLVDPPGSGLYNRVTRGVLYSPQEADGTRRAHPADTHLEGVGTNRLTANFGRCPRLDGAFRATDEEAVAMSRHLLAAEGLWVGGSAALNAVGAVRVAQLLGPGHTVATLLCDGGGRHVSKLWDEGWLKGAGLEGAAGKGLGWLLAQGGKKEEAARDG